MTVYNLKSILFLSVFLLLQSLVAQIDSSIYNSKPRHIKKAAKKSIKNGDYFSGITYLEKYTLKKPGKLSEKKLLADAYRMSRNYSKAEEMYQSLVDQGKSEFDNCYFYLGKMQLYNGKYEDAAGNLEHFKKNYRGKDKSEYRKELKYLLASCEAAPAILADPLNVKITHIDTSINKAHVELSPMPINTNEFIYSSLRTDTLLYIDKSDTSEQKQVRKFYKAQRKGSNWKFSGAWHDVFNDATSENANACFGLDSNVIYFTRCKENLSGKLICGIYRSHLDDGKWSKGIKLPEPINLGDYQSTQPAIGKNEEGEEVLYFVSDRDGGRGGRDIWFSEYNAKKQSFKKPRNLGNEINTAMDELSPFIDPNTQRMYFSSNGWPGIGGFDVFYSDGSLKTWTEPENMGPPINSSLDDMYFSIFEDESEGLFVSNRSGGVTLKNETCCDDIYHFIEKSKIMIAVTGKVTEWLLAEEQEDLQKDSLINVPGIGISLYSKTDTTDAVLVKKVVSQEDGSYFIPLKKDRSYILRLTDTSYYATSRGISTFDQEHSDTLKHDFSLTAYSDRPIVIQNIYYAYDKATLRKESEATIDTTLLSILKENPSIVVEIGSHTDSIGSDQYNKNLSQRRAQSVVDYLVNKGIAKERLKAKGYGENSPIAPNSKKDGSDNPEGRQLNRRTEFRIVGKVDGVREIIYKK